MGRDVQQRVLDTYRGKRLERPSERATDQEEDRRGATYRTLDSGNKAKGYNKSVLCGLLHRAWSLAMQLQLPKTGHSSSRALVGLVALAGAAVEIVDADVQVRGMFWSGN